MIGCGKWEVPINTMIYRGTGYVTISDINGEYDFKFELTGQALPEIKVSEIEESGNTLSAIGECDLLKGKKVPVSITFDGDVFTGIVKAPFVGKIKLNGHRIG